MWRHDHTLEANHGNLNLPITYYLQSFFLVNITDKGGWQPCITVYHNCDDDFMMANQAFVNCCELLTDTRRRHRLPCKPRELIVVVRELFMTQCSLIQHVVIERNYWNCALYQRRGKSHAAIGTLPVAIRNDSSGSRLIYSWSDLPSIVYLIMITPISLSRVLKAGYN